jgi:alpha,alpha-trehalase
MQLHMRTNQSRIEVAQVARTRVYDNGELREVARDLCTDKGYVCQHFTVDAEEGRGIRIEKLVSLFSSRDSAISEPLHQARKTAYRAGNFAEELDLHEHAWARLWRRFDIAFELAGQSAEDETEMILRLYTLHLLQTCSVHNMDQDVGVPARGWHGEAYRGHIFWDELYIFPTINFRIPEITRGLLMYRYRRLDEARAIAESEGFKGAVYPWQSGSDGREESQVLHLNPKSGEWIPDNTRLQRHVNAAIAYNIYSYYYVTGDKEFLDFYGMEMMLEIAKFWSDIAEYNDEFGRYEIKGVMGPDEFHDAYPGADRPGLDNNAYTNVMAAWVLTVTLELCSHLTRARLKDLTKQLDISEQDIEHWQEVSKNMYVPFHDGHIISQFQGYEKLEEFDWEGYSEKYGDIARLDRILEAEGDTVNRYKASKQADVLMLFYLFDTDDLVALFNRMGYDFQPEWIPDIVDHYLKRTSHGSTLSNVVHAWIISRSNRCLSWELFKQALQSDVADIQGGTTPEGIHVGAMAGTVDIIQRGYTDVTPRGDVLWFNPSIPVELERMRMRLRFRGQSLAIKITTAKMTVRAGTALTTPVKIGYEGEIYELAPGEKVDIELKEGAVCAIEPEPAS